MFFVILLSIHCSFYPDDNIPIWTQLGTYYIMPCIKKTNTLCTFEKLKEGYVRIFSSLPKTHGSSNHSSLFNPLSSVKQLFPAERHKSAIIIIESQPAIAQQHVLHDLDRQLHTYVWQTPNTHKNILFRVPLHHRTQTAIAELLHISCFAF